MLAEFQLPNELHARIQKILSELRGGPTNTGFFLDDEGWEDPNTTIGGPSSTRQQNAI